MNEKEYNEQREAENDRKRSLENLRKDCGNTQSFDS